MTTEQAPEYLFRASWSITDEDLTHADLVRQAEQDLPDLLYEARAVITGPMSWRLVTPDEAGRQHADCADGLPDLVLMLTAPASPWADPAAYVRPKPLDTARIHELHTAGHTPAEIAADIGARVGSVHRELRRSRTPDLQGANA